MSRYIIVGAGAIGGALGGRLTQHNLEAVLVARGEHAVVLCRDGLRLRTPDEDSLIRVHSVTSPQSLKLGVDDVLVVATKTHQAAAALIQWADVPVFVGDQAIGTAGELLPVCMALNGVAGESMAARYFRRVFGLCVWVPAVHLVPGEVLLRAAPTSGMFHLGAMTAVDNREQGLLEQIQSDWSNASFKIALQEDVMQWKYRKLLNNLGNSFQALIGSNGDCSQLIKAARDEACGVLEAAGIDLVSDETEAAARADSFTVRPVPGEPVEMGGSTWQSLARGTKNIETDYLNGEIVSIAHRHGMSAPINAKIASISRTASSAGQLPGEISAEQIADLLQQS